MNEIFQPRGEFHYNLRYISEFIIPPIQSVYHLNESVSYLGLKTWELIPPVIRCSHSLSVCLSVSLFSLSLSLWFDERKNGCLVTAHAGFVKLIHEQCW